MFKLKVGEKVKVPEGYVYVPSKKVVSLWKKHRKHMLMDLRRHENHGIGFVPVAGFKINEWVKLNEWFFCIKKEYATWNK